MKLIIHKKIIISSQVKVWSHMLWVDYIYLYYCLVHVFLLKKISRILSSDYATQVLRYTKACIREHKFSFLGFQRNNWLSIFMQLKHWEFSDLINGSSTLNACCTSLCLYRLSNRLEWYYMYFLVGFSSLRNKDWISLLVPSRLV